ncbi:cap guanine-N7 methyltransferase [Trypanosoma cruzi]|uniref:mRNA (guanine-N(7))-methyltransferase n=1 Tax=Trypanosoma cruzi TaxID=5693 RepID=A0A2V2XJK4_TRYCR|nr:cap guanine-N7 methyltransferase [Trypanosoma cruzi]
MLMAAIAGALASNGVFIATTVDDEVLAERVREKRTESTGLYALHFDSEPVWEGDRLAVGTKYLFELEGFVDCEEYVVPASYVRERAYYYGLEEVTEYSKTFRSFYEEYKKDSPKIRDFICFPAIWSLSHCTAHSVSARLIEVPCVCVWSDESFGSLFHLIGGSILLIGDKNCLVSAVSICDCL